MDSSFSCQKRKDNMFRNACRAKTPTTISEKYNGHHSEFQPDACHPTSWRDGRWDAKKKGNQLREAARRRAAAQERSEHTPCLVWCCGFVASSTSTLFGELGICVGGLQRATKAASEAHDNSSRAALAEERGQRFGGPERANLCKASSLRHDGTIAVDKWTLCCTPVE